MRNENSKNDLNSKKANLSFKNISFQQESRNARSSLQKSCTEIYYRNNDTLNSRKEASVNKTREEKFKNMLMRFVSPSQNNKDRQKSVNISKGKREERFLILYHNGQIKAAKDKIKIQKGQEEREEKIMSQCTFKPKIRGTGGQKDKHISIDEFYEKSVEWKNKQKEKIEKFKVDSKKKEIVYTFKPEIHVSSKNLFNPKKNIDKNDKNTKKFMERLENARTEDTKKKEKVSSNGKNKVPQKLNYSVDKLPHNQEKLNNVVKNLRNKLQEIRLESTNERFL